MIYLYSERNGREAALSKSAFLDGQKVQIRIAIKAINADPVTKLRNKLISIDVPYLSDRPRP
jgi:hypothetical protein